MHIEGNLCFWTDEKGVEFHARVFWDTDRVVIWRKVRSRRAQVHWRMIKAMYLKDWTCPVGGGK